MGPSFAMFYRAVVAAGATVALRHAASDGFASAWPSGTLLLIGHLCVPSVAALVAALPEPRRGVFRLSVFAASIATSIVLAIVVTRGDHPDYTDEAIRETAVALAVVGALLMTFLGWAVRGVVLGVGALRRHRTA